MNRRSFLRLFGAGLPAVVVAEKIGLIDKARKYFFAPKAGWEINGYQYEMYFVNAHGVWVARPNTGIIENISKPLNLEGLPYYLETPLTCGTFYGISRSPQPVRKPKVGDTVILLA